MRHLFLNETPALFPTWIEAFPGAEAASPKRIQDCTRGLLWVRTTHTADLTLLLPRLRALHASLPVVVLADEPEDAGALAAIRLGAAGYCNSHAAPEVLQTIARVVMNGGLWLGQSMMRRVLSSLAARLDVSAQLERHFPPEDADLARLILAGADHEKIATTLGIPEAVVPHSISALFARAGVQDCLQLLLRAGSLANA